MMTLRHITAAEVRHQQRERESEIECLVCVCVCVRERESFTGSKIHTLGI